MTLQCRQILSANPAASIVAVKTAVPFKGRPFSIHLTIRLGESAWLNLLL